MGEHLVEKDSKNTQHATRTAVRLYLDSHSCSKFVFNYCGLFCLCYITKHLMTDRLRLGKHQDSRETNQMFPS